MFLSRSLCYDDDDDDNAAIDVTSSWEAVDKEIRIEDIYVSFF